MKDRLLNSKEACAYLNIKERTLQLLTSQKRIDYLICGGRRFKKDWLDEFIERERIRATNI